ncbi:MAG: MBL fold metallo-hydrolase, partial [Pseudolabrys sp.]
MSATAKPEIRAFFDEPTNTVSYLVWDAATMEGAVIDPVLDYDFRSGKATFASADAILAAAKKRGIKIGQVLETHAHADHLSGAPYIKLKTGAKVSIGEHIRDVQRIFRPVFNATDVSGDGSEFDHLFKHGERFKVGAIDAEVMYTPG